MNNSIWDGHSLQGCSPQYSFWSINSRKSCPGNRQIGERWITVFLLRALQWNVTMLSAHCHAQINELIDTVTCRRNLVAKLFPSAPNVQKPKGCLCCDLCSKSCDCSQHSRIPSLPFQVMSDHQKSVQRTRHVSEVEKALLHGKLLAYRNTLLPSSTNEFIPIGSTAILYEFDHYC